MFRPSSERYSSVFRQVAGNAGEITQFIANCSRAAGFINHGRDQAQKRGISEDMINQAIQLGSRSKGNSKGTTKYKGTKVWVVLNTSCAVVSTGWN